MIFGLLTFGLSYQEISARFFLNLSKVKKAVMIDKIISSRSNYSLNYYLY